MPNMDQLKITDEVFCNVAIYKGEGWPYQNTKALESSIKCFFKHQQDDDVKVFILRHETSNNNCIVVTNGGPRWRKPLAFRTDGTIPCPYPHSAAK